MAHVFIIQRSCQIEEVCLSRDGRNVRRRHFLRCLRGVATTDLYKYSPDAVPPIELHSSRLINGGVERKREVCVISSTMKGPV